MTKEELSQLQVGSALMPKPPGQSLHGLGSNLARVKATIIPGHRIRVLLVARAFDQPAQLIEEDKLVYQCSDKEDDESA